MNELQTMDPNQMSLYGIWSGSALFAEACLSKYLQAFL